MIFYHLLRNAGLVYHYIPDRQTIKRLTLKPHQEGARPQQIGRYFDIHRSTFFRWKQTKPDWSVSAIQAEITRLFRKRGDLRFTPAQCGVMSDRVGNRAR